MRRAPKVIYWCPHTGATTLRVCVLPRKRIHKPYVPATRRPSVANERRRVLRAVLSQSKYESIKVPARRKRGGKKGSK